MQERWFLISMKFREVPDYADVYTIQEFVEAVKNGGLTNYDGSGHLARIDANDKIWESEIKINCSVSWLQKQPKDFTHICWYNK